MPVEENELSNLLLWASLLSRILFLRILDALANLLPLLSIYMYLQPCEMSTHSICSSAYQPSFLGGILALSSKPKTSNCPEGEKKCLQNISSAPCRSYFSSPLDFHPSILVASIIFQCLQSKGCYCFFSLCCRWLFICSCQNNCSGASYFISTRSKSISCDF